MFASIVLWLVSRQMGWNLSAYPGGTWYFNPFCWQVLFVFGAWCALGGARKSIKIIQSPYTLYFCIAYLILGLVMTMAGKFTDFGALFPHWLYSDLSIRTTRRFLAPYRFVHFVVIVIMVIRFRAEGLAGAGMEGVRSPRRLRPAVARSVLRRRVPVLCRAFHAVAELGLAARASLRQRGWDIDHDDRGLLHFVVEEAGQATAEGAGAGQGRLIPAGLPYCPESEVRPLTFGVW